MTMTNNVLNKKMHTLSTGKITIRKFDDGDLTQEWILADEWYYRMTVQLTPQRKRAVFMVSL